MQNLSFDEDHSVLMKGIKTFYVILQNLSFDEDPDVLMKMPEGMDPSVVWFLQPKQAHMFLMSPGLKAFPCVLNC